MALSERVEFQTEVKLSAGLILEMFGSKKQKLPQICDTITCLDLLEGKWGTVGYVIVAHYFFDGKASFSKEMIEAVDPKDKSITYVFLDGDLKKLYKTLRFTFQAISKCDINYLKTTVEYEKINEDVPDPDSMPFLSEVIKEIDAHFLQA